MQKFKVTTYGDQLMVLQPADKIKSTTHLSLHSVKDCKKPLTEWLPICCTDIKKIDSDWENKFINLWKKTGSVEIEINLIDLI